MKVLAIALSLVANGSGSAIPFDELALGGVKPGDTQEQVRAHLGPPVTRSRAEGVYDTKFEYPGLEIIFGGGAEIIASSSAEHCTPTGACPGISEAQLTNLYGPGVRQQRQSEIAVVYSVPGDACLLEAIISQDAVRTLTVLCQP